jgi:hypothetical protein
VRISDEERDLDVMYEIVRSKKRAKTKVGVSVPGQEEFATYGDIWFAVDVPEGMTVREFDDAVLGSLLTQAQEFNGAVYYGIGAKNSNTFVYRVIKGAGGLVPGEASAHILFVPGICGGWFLGRGGDCS